MRGTSFSGIGIGLRWELLDELVAATTEQKKHLSFLEVSPENFMGRGGVTQRALRSLAEEFPITTHGLSLSLGGTEPLNRNYLCELKSFLAEYPSTLHSDHLCFSTHDGVALHDLLPVCFSVENLKRIARRIREASDALERRIAIENISYYVELGGDMPEPDFIGELLGEADADLVLDLNNLDVNAENHGFSAAAWLEKIPLDRVVEVHVAGPERSESGMWIDTHGAPVRSTTLDLLEHFTALAGERPVLIERDHKVPELSELLAEVEVVRSATQCGLERFKTMDTGHV